MTESFNNAISAGNSAEVEASEGNMDHGFGNFDALSLVAYAAPRRSDPAYGRDQVDPNQRARPGLE